MKKMLAVASAVIIGLSLTSCSTNTNEENFDSKVINTTPHWDLENIKLGTWVSNSGNAPQPTQTAAIITDKVTTEPSNSSSSEVSKSDSLKETLSYNFTRLIDSKTKCIIEGRIMYQEAYKQSRGDLYNSKNYLYSIVPASENPVAGEKNEMINGNSYVTGTYTLPKALGDNIYHKTSVRTFSTPVKINGSSGFAKDELGNYNSDLTLGLPTVIFDMSCPQQETLNTPLWNDGVNMLKLAFDAIPVPEKTVK